MEKLVSNNKLLQALFQSSAEGILVVDEQGNIVLANPRCRQMFDYDETELKGKPLEILVSNNLKHAHARMREEFFKQPSMQPMGIGREIYGRTSKGKIFPIEVSLSHMEVEGAKFAIGLIVDITKQQLVADENNLLSKVFHESLNSVFIINSRNFLVVKANTAALKLTGHTLKELQQHTLWDLEFGLDQTSFQQIIAPLFTEEKNKVVFTSELKRKNQSSFPAEIHLQIFDHKEERVLLMIAIDITERKQAEVSLRKEKEKAQRYLDTAASIFLVLGKEGQVRLINQKGLEVIGCSEEEIIGKNWFNYFLPSQVKTKVKKVFEQMISGELKALEYFENPVLTKQGEERMIEWHNAIIYDEQGQPEATLSSGVEITEKKRKERDIMKALIEGQEAERERIAKELHDGLGQHHTAMQLNLNALEKYCVDAGPDAKHLFEQVKSILQYTIQDMKAMARNLMPGVLRDYGLVKGLEYLCQSLNETHLVYVKLQVYHMDMALDTATTIGLYRIAQEVINNAIRHGKASEIQVQLLGHEKTLLLLIEDDGIGFKQDTVVSKNTFGLKNIEARVKTLQGTFHIDSHPEQGTTISVEIPIH